MTQRAFHPDAMAVLSWAADPSGRIEFRSPSLRRKLRDVAAHDPATGETVGDVWTWMKALFTHPSSGVEREAQDQRPIDPSPWIDAVREHLDGDGCDGGEKRFGLVSVFLEPLTQVIAEEQSNDDRAARTEVEFETISARVMHPHGLRLRGGGIREIFDLVFVRRRGAGRDGLQGLLQPAWERVLPVVKANVRTASLRLISRSLSHNIGSHALMYLQKQLEAGTARREKETTREFERKLATMSRYLRERFEMMASVSVESPLAWGRDTIRGIVEDFGNNRLLRERICRSEGVELVTFPAVSDPDPLDIEVGLPGELIARHAFMLMIENVARDCAKHQREPRSVSSGGRSPRVTVHVEVGSPTEQRGGPGLLQVELWASRDPAPGSGGDDLARTADRLNRMLREGVICDHEGIPQREWGTLERLMCAAYLRGHRPESLLPDRDPRDVDVLGIRTPDSEPPLIEARYEPRDHTLRWRFYLPIARKPVAVVSPGTSSGISSGFECTEWDPESGVQGVLGRVPAGCSAIMFVAMNDDHMRRITKFVAHHRHRLPGLVYVSNAADVPSDRAAMLDAWIERHRPRIRVRVCDGDRDVQDAANQCRFVEFARAETEVDDAALVDDGAGPNGFVLLRHPSSRPALIRRVLEKSPAGSIPAPNPDAGFLNVLQGLHLEGHEAADRLRGHLASPGRERILEIVRAGAMKVLVADERIGECGGAADHPAFHEPPDLCTVRQRWALAGVDIMSIGRSANDADILASLLDRIAKVEGGYDYVFIHLGILEKCARTLAAPADPAGRLWALIRELSGARGAAGEALRLIIHSGRTNPRPPAGMDPVDFRFCPLGNVERVLVGPVNCCKLDVIRMADALWLPWRGAS